ncbi:fibronectin type III domain-containing protein [Amycolatopsis benzoatilytica]|uniref:fibronectin type III domain-containing protein n=1 Tax=Amycolatopsis benzoatilytica TaxID=346045 RepID=UPI0003703DAE|nr:fibronectin type III domain-containing protein [Amycolatopsis benzoatilytica]
MRPFDVTEEGTEKHRRGLGAAVRARLVIAFLAAGCLTLIGVAVAGRAPMPSDLEYVQAGHWVYSDSLQSALHVDGGAGQVDAQASLPAGPGSQVVQGGRSGYVVDRSRITIFDKSTLGVENAITPPAAETPVALEVSGGPYLVYRNAGRIVRLGDPVATVSAGGPLTTPVATSDGTLWVHRIDTGAVCELPRGATTPTCPAQLPAGHSGLLALADDRPVLLDVTADTLSPVSKDGLGDPVAIGVKLPATAQVANNAVDGRLAVADPDRNQLHLIDTTELGKDRPAARPVSVDLPKDGRFSGPVATSHVVALVDETRNEVRTYDSHGGLKNTKKVPGGTGRPRLSHGQDDRLYVDSSDGSHVLVVDGDNGSVADVAVDEQARHQNESPPPAPPQPSDTGSAPPRPSAPPAPPPVADATPPGAPRNVRASAADGAVKVTWSAAADNGARITAYHLSWSGGSTTVSGSARRATLSGLDNGTSYVVTVVAENSAGRGPGASAQAATPGQAADAPSVTLTAGQGGKVSASWSEPDLHGADLVHYLVSATGAGDRQVSGTSAEFSGLSGSVTVTVRAVTRYSSGSALTGSAGRKTVQVPSGPPTVKITHVQGRGAPYQQLIVTVIANANGAPAKCTATVFGSTTSPVPCSGTTNITISNVYWAGQIGIDVTITSSEGTGSDHYQGQPAFVVVLGPLALLGARRGLKNSGKTKAKKEK